MGLPEKDVPIATPAGWIPAFAGMTAARRSLRGSVQQDENPSPDWAAIRAEYEAGERTVKEIGARHGRSAAAIHAKARRDLWKPRNRTRGVDRPMIIKRMFVLLERQVIQLGEDMTHTGEKEAAVLGKLASTLEKLIEIDNAAVGKPKPAQGRKMRDLRDQLAQRIEQLKRA